MFPSSTLPTISPWSRRRWLAAAALPLAAALPQPADAAPQAELRWRNRQSEMTYRRLGRTGFMVSALVMGGNRIAPDNWEHVLLAMDMGLNYLDTAPAYGRGASESGYANVIRSRPRDRFFLTTKVSLWDINRGKLYQDLFASLPATEQRRLRHAVREELERRRVFTPDYIGDYFSAQRGEVEAATLANVMQRHYGHRIDRQRHYRRLIIQSVEESLQRLGTDHVDILMCPHGASTPHELLGHPEIFEAFETLKKAGKVAHLGVSSHSDPAGVLHAAIDAGHYSVAMVACNIVNFRFLQPALDRAREHGLGVIAMKAARAVYSGRGPDAQDDPRRVRLIEYAVPGPLKIPQKAYLWVLRQPQVSAVISEMVDARLVRENLPLAAPSALS